MNLDTIGKYIKKFTEKHELKPVHLHSLRHTNASILIANGVDLETVSSRETVNNFVSEWKILPD